jgi:hypothetical protein
MHKYLTLLLLLTLTLFSATPKLYKPIGDPIYKHISSVKKMSEIGYFKNEKKQLLNFVKKANTHKKLGFAYDKKRRAKTLSKEEQKAYLNTLRSLDRELFTINTLAKDALPIFIKRRYVQSFYQLKATKLSFLRRDSDSAWLVKKYSLELSKKQRIRQKQQAKKLKNNKIAYQKMLRSSQNLNGTWQGISNDKTKLKAIFNENKLALSYITKNKTNLIKGTYTVNKTLNFSMQIRKLTVEERSHIRHVNIKRNYEIVTVSETELVLKYKDEVLTLTRK